MLEWELSVNVDQCIFSERDGTKHEVVVLLFVCVSLNELDEIGLCIDMCVCGCDMCLETP